MNKEETENSIKDQAKEAVRKASPWLVWLGRFGYAAKGIIFVIIGVLAAYSAVSAGKANDGTSSAMKHIEELPFGQILLIIVALGLVCYALWRSIQAFMDTENEGSNAKGLITRGIYAAIALIYLGLAFSAVKIILDVQNNKNSSQSWTALLLAQPFGQWLVAAVGIIIISRRMLSILQGIHGGFPRKTAFGKNERQRKNLGDLHRQNRFCGTRICFLSRRFLFDSRRLSR